MKASFHFESSLVAQRNSENRVYFFVAHTVDDTVWVPALMQSKTASTLLFDSFFFVALQLSTSTT